MLSAAKSKPRARKHRQHFLNLIEVELQKQRQDMQETEHDVPLWRGKNDSYQKNFISKETWMQIRSVRPEMQGHKEIWFSDATPKYAFVNWLVVKNRIATGERMLKWGKNVDTSCVLCNFPLETREHLFFQCPYSSKVWRDLAGGLLKNRHTEKWQDIMKELAGKDLGVTTGFVLGYVFQNTIHSIWRERNDRRHGEKPSMTEKIVKLIDKNIRNRLSTLRVRGEEKYAQGTQVWFASRQYHNHG